MLAPFRQGTIVLASRDEELTSVVSTVLESLGERAPRLSAVRCVSDCLSAVRLLGPSLLLLDDGIQDVPGRNLLEQVLEARPGTPVVYVAAHHSLDLEREVRRRGVLFYIARPEEKAVLESRLGCILNGLARGSAR